MSTILSILILFAGISLAKGQVIISQDFATDPFTAANITTDYPVNATTGCLWPSYVITNNYSVPCSAFPAETGDGDFLVIDNVWLPGSHVYRETGVTFPAGDYVWSFEAITRFDGPGTPGSPSVNLDIRIGGNTVGSAVVFFENDNFVLYGAPFTLPATVTNGVFEIVQTNNGNNRDFAIDNIFIVRETVPPCDLGNVNLSFTVTGDDYCFSPVLPNNPDIATYQIDWNFGDGNTGTGPNACNTYASGQYTVCMTIRGFRKEEFDPCDEVTICRDICVVATSEPCTCGLASINTTIDGTNKCAPAFNINATPNECSTILGYSLNAGDGNTYGGSFVPDVLLINYAAAGDYFPTVTFQVTDGKNTCEITEPLDKVVCRQFKTEPGSGGAPTARMELFPNPAEDLLQVRPHLPLGAKMEIIITGMDGRILMRRSLANDRTEFSLDVGELSAGMYQLILRNGDGQISAAKFVVQ
ncbi:MAG: PKD domain-containing protein [Bacteroidota bacterium]